MTFTVDDVSPWLATPEQYQAMRERVAKARNEGPFTPPGLTDTVSMPGNQGGSNWGTTAANPEKGLVFVIGVNQVALLKLEDVKTRRLPEGRGGGGGGQGGTPLQAGFLAYQQYCTACHGANMPRVTGSDSPRWTVTVFFFGSTTQTMSTPRSR